MKSDFINFRDIDIENPFSWRGKKILSFDIDWAPDEQINYVLDILEPTNKKACFFITHNTSVIKRIRENKNFELGLHPNFNPLILSEPNAKKAIDVMNELKEIVPEAGVLRSHSMTTSGRWLGMFKDFGIKYLSNYLMFGKSNIEPFYQINGLIEVPVYYADDGVIYLNDNPVIKNVELLNENLIYNTGIRVFNFHPVHIFKNSTSFKNYKENSRPEMRAKGVQEQFIKFINEG